MPGSELVQRLRNDGQARPRLNVVEAKQDLPSLDLLAVADTQLTHHAASRVLHPLHVAINHDLARRDHRARELRGDGPPPDANHQKRGYGSDQTDMKRQRRLQLQWGRFHDTASPGSLTIRSGGSGAAVGRRSLLKTSSFGPNECRRPCTSVRARSTPLNAPARCATTMTIPPRARVVAIACVSASSPSESRLEFGSSRTSRKGSR